MHPKMSSKLKYAIRLDELFCHYKFMHEIIAEYTQNSYSCMGQSIYLEKQVKELL